MNNLYFTPKSKQLRANHFYKSIGICMYLLIGNFVNAQQVDPAKIKAGIDSIKRADTASISVNRQQVNNDLKTTPVNSNNNSASAVYGAQLFTTASLSFEPNLRIATPPDYIVGPDDEFLLNIYGIQEANYKLQVLPEGSVYIPQVGLIPVNGLTVEAATKRIQQKLIAGPYKTLASGQSKMSITLTKIKSIRITILGANKPGNYTVSSLSTVFNALYLCGGPDNATGSYRAIELLRNNKIIRTIDLYDFLVKGNIANNLLLKENDVINIPTYTKRVKLLGEVKRPGIFELKDNETLEQLILYAGGFSDKAYTATVKINQITDKERSIKDVLHNAFNTYQPQKGDEIKVEAVLDRLANSVTISGAVYRPGQFELVNGLTLTALIKKADGLKPDAYKVKGVISRTYDDLTKEIISFDLAAIIQGATSDIVLIRDDQIVLSSINDFKDAATVSISGAVRKPVSVPFQKNITLKDMLFLAGGFTESAYKAKGIINRTNDDLTKEIISFNLAAIIQGTTSDIILKRNDQIVLSSINDFKDAATVSISGEVRKPGSFPFQQNINLKDLLFLSGGFTEGATSLNIELSRRIKSEDGKQEIDTIAKVIEIATDRDISTQTTSISLEPFDQITVRKKPGYIAQQSVSISGEVLYPGTFTIQTKKERISDLLRRAGGFTKTAYPPGVSLIRLDKTSAIIKKQKLDIIEQVQKSIKDSSNNVIEDVISPNTKIALDINQIINNPGSKEDLFLEEGDAIDVPRFESLVKISGQVYAPGKVNYEEGRGLNHYIDLSGGKADNARLSRSYVIYPNGKVNKTHHYVFGLFRSYPSITPGTEIIVPKKTAKKAAGVSEFLSATTGILSLISLTVITLNLLK